MSASIRACQDFWRVGVLAWVAVTMRVRSARSLGTLIALLCVHPVYLVSTGALQMVQPIRSCFRKEPWMSSEWLDMALGLARAGGGSAASSPHLPHRSYSTVLTSNCWPGRGLKPIDSLLLACSPTLP